MVTIVIPILRFNEFSETVISELGKTTKTYDNLHFLFAVSDNDVSKRLNSYLSNCKLSFEVYIANNYSSNFLRSIGRFAKTEYVFYQDCDDYANYDLINDFTKHITNHDCVYCFNVTKHIYAQNGTIIKSLDIFTLKSQNISDIKLLPTCVYSKFIPTKFLKLIDFPNLPYSQDWAISYQLFILAKHFYINQSAYIYNNYPTSSSQKKKSTLYGTKRVNAYFLSIYRALKNAGKKYEADFLRFRYNILLHERYKVLNINYIDTHLSWRLLFYNFTMHNFSSVLYNYFKILFNF